MFAPVVVETDDLFGPNALARSEARTAGFLAVHPASRETQFAATRCTVSACSETFLVKRMPHGILEADPNTC